MSPLNVMEIFKLADKSQEGVVQWKGNGKDKNANWQINAPNLQTHDLFPGLCLTTPIFYSAFIHAVHNT